MSPSELKRNYEIKNPCGKFFSRENMTFAGDTMANFGCRKEKGKYLLYRKNKTRKGFSGGFIFDAQTFKYLGVYSFDGIGFIHYH